MKRRVRKIANFFAFNLLFFALYLNFVHKDKSNIVVAPATQQSSVVNNGAGTVLIDNPDQYIKKSTVATSAQTAAPTGSQQKGEEALQLSIN